MNSDEVKKGFQRAPHRGLLRAVGLVDKDFEKPFIGIANSYCDIVPGHKHLHQVAETVKDAVRDAGVRSAVGFSVRFGAALQTMQRYVREGRAGRLLSLWARRMSFLDPARWPAWRQDHALSGGVLLEINVHELDWLMALGGEVRSVYARTWAEGQDAPRANDHNWVVLNFEGGAVGTHEGSQVSPVPVYERAAIGTEGGLQTTDWGNGLCYAARGQKTAPVELDAPFDLRGHFLDCIEEGIPCVADVEWGRKVMRVAEAVLASARTGQVQHLMP